MQDTPPLLTEVPAAAPPTHTLKLCPACANYISMRAAACPHCGEPFHPHAGAMNVALGVILGLLGFGVICAALAFFGGVFVR